MSRFGVVIKALGDRAVISTARRGVCDGCGERSSCAFDLILGKGTPDEVAVENPVRARPGDLVEFDLPGHTELKVSLLVWAVPLAGLVAGAVAGANLAASLGISQDLGTLLGALASLALASVGVVFFDRRARKDPRLVPRIIKVVNPSHCPATPGQDQEPRNDGDPG